MWFNKAKLGQKCKKSEEKKVAPLGIEPGSLDPKSDALTTELLGKQFWGAKNQSIYN